MQIAKKRIGLPHVFIAFSESADNVDIFSYQVLGR